MALPSTEITHQFHSLIAFGSTW